MIQLTTTQGVLTLTPGDRVVTPITKLNISRHHAIYAGLIEGIPHFFENKIGEGVRLVSAKLFFRENPVIDHIIRMKGSIAQINKRIRWAIKMIGTKYDLIRYNCEHFANEFQYRHPHSRQVALVVVVLIIGFIVYTIITSYNSANSYLK